MPRRGGGRQGAKDASSASSATASSGGRQGAGGGGPSNSVGPIIGRLIESLAGGKPGGNNSNSSSSTNNVPSSSAGGSGSGQGASAASGGASLGTASSGAGAAPLGSSSTGALLLQQQQQQAAARRGVSGVREKKKVTPVLPWLLVSSGRLDTRDLTQIASHRGLGAILELGLTRGPGGALMLRGSEATALGGLGASGSMAEVNVSSLLASAAAAGTGPGGGPGSNGLATVGPALQPPQQPAGAAARALVGLAGAPQGGPAAARVGAAAGPGGAQQQQAGGGGAPAAVDVRYRCLVHLAAALQRLVVRCGTGVLPASAAVLWSGAHTRLLNAPACLHGSAQAHVRHDAPLPQGGVQRAAALQRARHGARGGVPAGGLAALVPAHATAGECAGAHLGRPPRQQPPARARHAWGQPDRAWRAAASGAETRACGCVRVRAGSAAERRDCPGVRH